MDWWYLATRPRTTFALLPQFLQNVDLQREIEDLSNGLVRYLRDGMWTPEGMHSAVMGLLLVTSLGHRGVAVQMVTVGKWVNHKVVGPKGNQAVHVWVSKHKTRKFFGPADVFITRAYIRQLVTVSCFNAVRFNIWRLFCSHFNEVFLFFLRLTSTTFGPSSKEGTTSWQSSPSSSFQQGALWLTCEAQSIGCARGWWRWG